MKRIKQIEEEITKGVGAVFRFINPEYSTSIHHFKILIGIDKSKAKDVLLFLTCTSKSIVMRSYVLISNVLIINKDEYCELSEETSILCNDIETVNIDDLVGKYLSDCEFKVCERISDDLLIRIYQVIKDSREVSKKHKKIIRKNLNQKGIID
ncbi:MAG: hypothetical protein WC831_02440 [Parcubacteria group bacterium]|jgi:hypothetical protein